jgi:hypothetical protein
MISDSQNDRAWRSQLTNPVIDPERCVCALAHESSGEDQVSRRHRVEVTESDFAARPTPFYRDRPPLSREASPVLGSTIGRSPSPDRGHFAQLQKPELRAPTLLNSRPD